MYILRKADWSPIIEKGQVKFEDYKLAQKKAKELSSKIGGVIITSEEGLRLKGLEEQGYNWEITDKEKGEISFLSPNRKSCEKKVFVGNNYIGIATPEFEVGIKYIMNKYDITREEALVKLAEFQKVIKEEIG